MKKNHSYEHTGFPPFLQVALNYKAEKLAVPHPNIELDLLVRTTLAMQGTVDAALTPFEAKEAYKKLAQEAVLLIEGCQQILSIRASMLAISEKEAAKKKRERLPRTISFADGVYLIVGDKNPGPNRGLKKLKEFLEAFSGESIFSEETPLPRQEWVEQQVEYWRENRFNNEEVHMLRDKRNDYINRGILEGDIVSAKIVTKSAFLATADPTVKISDKSIKSSDRKRRQTRR
jgi:hypothetical protein